MSRRKPFLATLAAFLLASAAASHAAVTTDPDASPRVKYAAGRLTEALKEVGAEATPVVMGNSMSRTVASAPPVDAKLQAQGYVVQSLPSGAVAVIGGDDSGVLYGALDLAARVRAAKKVPDNLRVIDAPSMILRGPCLGMQKTTLLPGRKVYEYPYTPENFPFFYDKKFWDDYLDYLADQRMNILYLWNGHPFPSLVRVPDYPDAVEVPDDVLSKNQEMFRYITAEADKRGIWVVQMFYNIFLSKPLADKHGLSTQLKEPTPLASDYTRKSIAEFMRQYPHVGLMVCLGEALEGDQNKIDWMVNTIIPGVKDGMKLAGLKEEPPLILRTHAMPAGKVVPEAVKYYKNLYTEQKFNGESLTTYEPRGRWAQQARDMTTFGAQHLVNIHILANLEPFRYGATEFIRKSVLASEDTLNAKGLHLYPLAYWDWPVAPDVANPPLGQIQRDWIWYEAWARYAWNPRRDAAEDKAYWVGRLTEMYGSREAAEKILSAYNDSGECAPMLIRRYGITEGNRQTLSLGMTLDQLVNPMKYGAIPELWESQAPPGERLDVFVAREWEKKPHEGETPATLNKQVLDFSARAVAAIDAAAPLVTKNKEEFERLRNDVHCIRAMTLNYVAKVHAAEHVLRYTYGHEVSEMERAAGFLAESLEHFKTLERLTRDTYRYANTMQTSQRKIPFVGGSGGSTRANYHWSQVLPLYEKELADFRAQVEAIKSGKPLAATDIAPLPRATFTVHGKAETYTLDRWARPFSDRDNAVQQVAPEIRGLTGIRMSADDLLKGGARQIEIETDRPIQLLVGYFKTPGDAAAAKNYLQLPSLEVDAGAADLVNPQPAIENAVVVADMPKVDVHVVKLAAGKHALDLRGGNGTFLVLGAVPADVQLTPRDAGLSPARPR
jgi:hypothetical protein